MKITVKANDFCPDDCPAATLDYSLHENERFKGKNAEMCDSIYQHVLKKKIYEARMGINMNVDYDF